MEASILYPHPPKNREKMGSELTGKMLKNEFFPTETYFFDLGIEFLVKKYFISTQDRSKGSLERPIQAQFHFLLDFSRIFALQFSSGIASAYRKPIFTIPGSHPSL